jgi:hypothetical protein
VNGTDAKRAWLQHLPQPEWERPPAGLSMYMEASAAAMVNTFTPRAPGFAACEKMYRRGRVKRQPVCVGAGGTF